MCFGLSAHGMKEKCVKKQLKVFLWYPPLLDDCYKEILILASNSFTIWVKTLKFWIQLKMVLRVPHWLVNKSSQPCTRRLTKSFSLQNFNLHHFLPNLLWNIHLCGHIYLIPTIFNLWSMLSDGINIIGENKPVFVAFQKQKMAPKYI